MRNDTRERRRSPIVAHGTAILFALLLAPAAACAQEVHTAVERDARGAQRRFESFRRERLPRVPPRGAACDLTIGRMCYWDDNREPPLPAEPADIMRERRRLSTQLARFAAQEPASDFITGQRVRYDLEAGNDSTAMATLDHCAATPWWCQALRGLVWHTAGLEKLSASAFDSALAAMPDERRCTWLDVRDWLPPGVHQPDCAARERFAHLVFWLAAPLLTWNASGARNEFLARRALAAAIEGTATPEGLSWGSDILETAMRFGWPTRWSREREPPQVALTIPTPQVIGHEPWPSFSVMPVRRAVEHPLQAAPHDWVLTDQRTPPMRFAPGWIVALDTLNVQIARFRGPPDSLIVVAAFDAHAPDDSLAPQVGPVRAGALLAVDPDSTNVERLVLHSPLRNAIVLTAPARPALGAVEVVDSARGWAARWRAGIAPLDSGALLSDLLVGLADSTPIPPVLDSAVPRALGALRVAPGATLALYWELYAAASPEHPLPVSLRLLREPGGGLAAIGRALGLSHEKPPLAITWLDAGSDTRAPGRTLRVSIPDVPDGRYQLEILVNGDEAHGRATRELVVASEPEMATAPRKR